jgi:hypothetical protein
MRVGELIEELQRFDPMQPVYVPSREEGVGYVKSVEVRPLFSGKSGVGLPEEGFHFRTNIIGIVPVESDGGEED